MVFPSHPSSIATSLSAVRDDEQQAPLQLRLSSLRLLHQERTRHWRSVLRLLRKKPPPSLAPSLARRGATTERFAMLVMLQSVTDEST